MQTKFTKINKTGHVYPKITHTHAKQQQIFPTKFSSYNNVKVRHSFSHETLLPQKQGTTTMPHDTKLCAAGLAKESMINVHLERKNKVK